MVCQKSTAWSIHGTNDGKGQWPERVKKPFGLIPIDLVTDFRFASRIL